MKTLIITAPEVSPVSLNEIKAHCYIDPLDTDVNVHLASLISAATEYVEQVLMRKLITQTWKLLLDNWPGGVEITLPFGQCSAVNSVKYTDTDSVESTWSDSDYIVDTDSVPGRVVLGYGETWPTDQLLHVNPIAVEFISGYGVAANVPVPLKQAIKLLVGHWFENREPVVVGERVYNIPLTVDSLIWPYRLF